MSLLKKYNGYIILLLLILVIILLIIIFTDIHVAKIDQQIRQVTLLRPPGNWI